MIHGNIGATLRRFTRERKEAIRSDFVVYLQECDIGVENNPESFSQDMNSKDVKYCTMP